MQTISANEGSGIIFRFTKKQIKDKHKIKVTRAIAVETDLLTVQFPWDIFQLNDVAIRSDFELITSKRKSAPISKTNRVVKPSQVFIEKGAKVEHCIINAETGPVYIGKKAEVMEGSI